jgi:hypothetical protein
MYSTCSQSAKNLQYGSGFIQKTSLRPEKDLSTDRMVLHLRVKVNFTAIIQLTEILCCVARLRDLALRKIICCQVWAQ